MTADQRKILTDYLGIDYNSKLQQWNLVMPVVRKVSEALMANFKETQDTEAWALETNLEFYVVNVQLEKAIKHLIEAIQWVQKKNSS